tara:strand:+ start:57 stop:1328 length:1272 start_codon:yes stop_codon:yes gene_type:complete
LEIDNFKIAVIGLGYVGLPLAVAFEKKFDVVGFDIDKERIEELISGLDKTNEILTDKLKQTCNLTYSSNLEDLKECNFYIVTVPTPVNSFNIPDLSILKNTSELISRVLSPGNFVVYESTVYPGVTEEVCIPILESKSGLSLNKNLFCGYSPERINPGDKINKLETIKKITSGSNSFASKKINNVYKSIISAGTHLAPSIRVAEAAKVIENTQRDLNIALMNELSIIFDRLEINTNEVIEAASTKWNFHPYRPGLVGGHCIGVDPYYLTYKSELEGYIPDVILAGRKINDGMAEYVSDRIVRHLKKDAKSKIQKKCLILGYTFKENSSDIRNTKIYDLYFSLKKSEISVDIFDPLVSTDNKNLENVNFISTIKKHNYDAIIIAVPHEDFFQWGIEKIKSYGSKNCFVFDLKSAFPKNQVDGQL